MSKPFQPSATRPSSLLQAEYSPEERQTLLSLAYRAISPGLGDEPQKTFSPHLSEPRGVFTTLYLDGNLRGCVGYALPVAPLHRAVSETARAAAFEDSRFRPVSLEEAPRIRVSLSVLSHLVPLHPELIEVGHHGLVISLGAHRGLLLPQVALEHDWDRDTFLEQTCRKAGLPANAWQKGATLEAFTAEVFGEKNG